MFLPANETRCFWSTVHNSRLHNSDKLGRHRGSAELSWNPRRDTTGSYDDHDTATTATGWVETSRTAGRQTFTTQISVTQRQRRKEDEEKERLQREQRGRLARAHTSRTCRIAAHRRQWPVQTRLIHEAGAAERLTRDLETKDCGRGWEKEDSRERERAIGNAFTLGMTSRSPKRVNSLFREVHGSLGFQDPEVVHAVAQHAPERS